MKRRRSRKGKRMEIGSFMHSPRSTRIDFSPGQSPRTRRTVAGHASGRTLCARWAHCSSAEPVSGSRRAIVRAAGTSRSSANDGGAQRIGLIRKVQFDSVSIDDQQTEWRTVFVPKVSGRAGELLAAADNFRPSRTCCRRPLPCSTAAK